MDERIYNDDYVWVVYRQGELGGWIRSWCYTDRELLLKALAHAIDHETPFMVTFESYHDVKE
jgi:hypothetical protein